MVGSFNICRIITSVCLVFLLAISLMTYKGITEYKEGEEQKIFEISRIEIKLRRFYTMPDYIYFPASAAVWEACKKHRVNSNLLISLIRIESNWNPDARSHKGAVGLAQLMPGTAQELMEELDIKGPGENDMITNIYLGAYYLSKCMREFKSISLALKAYNGGPGAVAKNYKESVEFNRRVLAEYKRIK